MARSNARTARTTTNSRKGGTITKVDGEAASVAPEGTVAGTQSVGDIAEQFQAMKDKASESTAEQPDPEVVEQPAAEPGVTEEPKIEVVEPAEGDASDPVAPETTDNGDPAAEAPTEAPVAEVVAAEPVDPFANLPMTKIEDYEFRDLSTAETSDPRKYQSVQDAAREGKLPMKPNWKHATAMFTHGRVTREFRQGSVYGTIDQIIRSYGRAGVPSYVLVAKVRQAQIGNKRSHYCTALPPIGWAEGWIDTFVTRSHGKVMEKKAPPVTIQEVAEIQADDAKAEVQAEKIAEAA